MVELVDTLGLGSSSFGVEVQILSLVFSLFLEFLKKNNLIVMLQVRSKVKVIDNSGVKSAVCINVYGGSRTASVGDLVMVSLRKIKQKTKGRKLNLKKGNIMFGVVVRTKAQIKRQHTNQVIRFDENAVVLLNAQKKPIGTRVLGSIVKEIRQTRFLKVSLLASLLI